MIQKNKIKDLVVFTDENNSKYLNVLNDFLSYDINIIKVFRSIDDTKVMLIEYIDGVELCDIPDIDETLKNKIQQSIRSLHEHGMVSGDPHRGNFIIENGEVRIIDLSGKRASAQRKAKDRIDLERHYGIKNEVKDLGYYLLVYRKKIRNLMRRLKGKPAR